MKIPDDKGKKIILGLAAILLIVVIPLIVTMMVSFDVLHYVNTDNSWIGFWGSYLGAVMGGCITLYVLQKTIKANNSNLDKTLAAEKEKVLRDEKEKFCDEVCKMALNCSVDFSEYITSIANGDQINLETSKKILVTCDILEAKLKSKKANSMYIGCDELIEATNKIMKDFRDIVVIFQLGQRNDTWKMLALEFSKKFVGFNKAVKKFYIDNLST